ncbi:hypothetical protein BD413DRAFT_289399, partial [Trametes elegans]
MPVLRGCTRSTARVRMRSRASKRSSTRGVWTTSFSTCRRSRWSRTYFTSSHRSCSRKLEDPKRISRAMVNGVVACSRGEVAVCSVYSVEVDFNLSLSSFGVYLQGARNLVDFAISSPSTEAPTILFVSSVSVFTNYEGPAPALEAALDDPASAFGAGYSESKWMTECVLQNAAEERGVHGIVMRLGQVAGDKTGPLQRERVVPRDRQVSAGCLTSKEQVCDPTRTHVCLVLTS